MSAITKIILALLGSFFLAAAPVYALAPHKKTVELKEYTPLNIYLHESMGTKISFPFVLDEDNDDVPFTLDVTNPIFKTTRHPARNFFTIEFEPPDGTSSFPPHSGNMFINIAGYNISVLLNSTQSPEKHISDIEFTIGQEQRKNLISAAAKKQISKVLAEYRAKEAGIEQRIQDGVLKQLGQILQDSPDTSRIKERVTKDGLGIYLENMQTYGATYKVINFEVNNTLVVPVQLLDVKLFIAPRGARAAENRRQTVSQSHTLAESVKPRKTVKGTITTLSQFVGDPKYVLIVSVLTDRGSIEVSW